MSTSAGSFLVPTLDIDLVWHTHQLMAHKYDTDCRVFVGRFIDQYVRYLTFFFSLLMRTPRSDDKVEETALATAFDLTCRAWQVKDRRTQSNHFSNYITGIDRNVTTFDTRTAVVPYPEKPSDKR